MPIFNRLTQVLYLFTALGLDLHKKIFITVQFRLLLTLFYIQYIRIGFVIFDNNPFLIYVEV
jgi:hypothetical protein